MTWIATSAASGETAGSPVAAESVCENPLKAAVSQAEALEKGPNCKRAIEAWLQIIRQYPESEVGRVRLEMLLERYRTDKKLRIDAEPEHVVTVLTEAAELDVLAGMLLLAETVRREEPSTAFKWYSAAAAKGNPEAMTQVGLMHSNGIGTEPDLTKAVEWLQKAAEKEYAPAKLALAECYLFGKGTEKDEAKAIALLNDLIDGGDVRAMNRLGVCYQRGQGVPLDFARAVRLFSKATDAGYGEAAGNLGVMYMIGQGVPRSETKAFNLFQKGANLGGARAMFLMGRCYESGQGVEADPLQAASWFGKAADEGSPEAIETLRKKGFQVTPKRR
jgi:TPR repeat protein